MAGKKHWLWRAVDQDGVVLDVLVQSRRDKHAAKRLLRKLLKKADAAAARHDHRQAGELSRGEAGADARGRAPPAQRASTTERRTRTSRRDDASGR
jgi:transposase-like protein